MHISMIVIAIKKMAKSGYSWSDKSQANDFDDYECQDQANELGMVWYLEDQECSEKKPIF